MGERKIIQVEDKVPFKDVYKRQTQCSSRSMSRFRSQFRRRSYLVKRANNKTGVFCA